MIRITSPKGEIRYRNDPYALDLLPGNTVYDTTACIAFNCNKATPSKTKSASATPTAQAATASSTPATATIDQSPLAKSSRSPKVGTASPRNTKKQAKPETHFAMVKFKFGSTTFIAPFKVAVGDRVVCECDGKTESMGVVESVTTTPPPHRVQYKLIRHARTKDLEAFSQCVYGEVPAIDAAHQLFREREIDATIVDCEWQLDKTCFIAMIHFDHCTAEGEVSTSDFDAVSKALVEAFVCRVIIMPVVAPAMGPGGDRRMDAASNCNSSLRETTTSVGSFHSSRSTSRIPFVDTPPPEPFVGVPTFLDGEELEACASNMIPQ